MNVMLTSAGRRNYLVHYFKDALKGTGKVIAANSADCPSFYCADKSFITPLIYDEQYVPTLLNICKEEDVKLLVPLFDIDIPVLSRNISRFESIGTTVVAPNPEIAAICNDKWRTFTFLSRNSVRVPKTFLGLDNTLDALAQGKTRFPLIVKPRWGMGSLGILKVNDVDELRAVYSIVEREIFDTYLKYEASVSDEPVVICQEVLDGAEYGLDVMCDLNGALKAVAVKRKLAMRAGETDSAVTVDDPALEELGARLAELIPHPGNLDVDVFVVDGSPFVLELNARFGGGYPFTHAAGADLPSALIAWADGKQVDSSSLAVKNDCFSFKDIAIRTVGRINR